MKIYFITLLLAGLATGQMDGVNYLLWTRANPGNEQEQILIFNDVDSLAASNFDGSKRTYFAYHGWNNNGRQDFLIDGKTKTLEIEDANFISVDWETLADSPIYTPSVSNLYEVAEQTANYIVFLTEQTSLTPANIHVWGHSLGGHAAGMTGYNYMQLTGQKISRITGLDPAAPSFENEGIDRRIDSSQADFVDIIHTNAGTVGEGAVGLETPTGHVDFYPNGGSNQPGCLSVGPEIIDMFAGCSHGRANEYFVESITGSVPFTSTPCDSWEAYEAGSCDCGQGCLDMGFHVDQSLRGLYYLRTNRESPFAQG